MILETILNVSEYLYSKAYSFHVDFLLCHSWTSLPTAVFPIGCTPAWRVLNNLYTREGVLMVSLTRQAVVIGLAFHSENHWLSVIKTWRVCYDLTPLLVI